MAGDPVSELEAANDLKVADGLQGGEIDPAAQAQAQAQAQAPATALAQRPLEVWIE